MDFSTQLRQANAVITALEAQRNEALTARARAEANVALLTEALTAAKSRIAEMETAKPPTPTKVAEPVPTATVSNGYTDPYLPSAHSAA